jgi:alkylation response protein AidB-like acyl-CoA dehydrogenase
VVGAPSLGERYVPGILRGDHFWGLGFSEPEAGSDLASLRTKAYRDGDEYVVNGSKIWTSNAQVADYCEMLVRTDPDAPKHKGITWVVMDMTSPGIEVRPIKTLKGESEFSEMFLHDVRIPVANRVGDENDGWRVAMVTFAFERGTAFVSELLGSMALVSDLVEVARQTPRPGRGTWWDDAATRDGLARVSAELDAQWAYTKRNVSRAARYGNAGVGGSVFKHAYPETRHRLGDLAMAILGRDGLALGARAGAEDHVTERLYAISLSIAAGTSEIQRNIVGERMLGLPKER